MKHPFTLEPKLRFWLDPKGAKRKSTKSYRKTFNRIFRRNSKRNVDFDVKLLKRRINYEY